MPRSRTPATYGPEYEQLLLTAHNTIIGPEPILTLPMPSEKHAKSFRMKFYGYLRALRKEGLRHDLIEKANELSITLSGPSLLFFHCSETWDAEAIRQGLGLSKSSLPPIAPTAHSALVQKLAEIRSRTAKEKAERASQSPHTAS